VVAHRRLAADPPPSLRLATGRAPLGRTAAPLGRTAAPLGRTAGPLGRTAAPLGLAADAGVSRRERDVLELLAEGCSTREIAVRLAYSERTIKNVLQELTTRLQLRNRTQAVAHAVRNGWI
jgi:DNA-binding NarL/FixJ family response regulator